MYHRKNMLWVRRLDFFCSEWRCRLNMNLSHIPYWTRVRIHSPNAKIVRHRACAYTIWMNYTFTNIQVDTLVWLIPILYTTLTVASTTPLSFGIEESTSWWCKQAKKTLRKTSCEVNWNLTINCHWRLCVHYHGINRSMTMDTLSFYQIESSSVE